MIKTKTTANAARVMVVYIPLLLSGAGAYPIEKADTACALHFPRVRVC